MLHVQSVKNQHKIMKRAKPEFNGDIANIMSNTIVTADGSSHRSNETFMVKM